MRFVPDLASKPPVVQKDDLNLFTTLYKAGAMTTPMLLAFDRRKPTVVYDRLHRFSGHGYVAKVPNDVRHHAFDPNKPDVFVLADKGVALARDYCGSDRPPIRAQDIRHCLSNAEFVLSLMLALDAAGRTLVDWIPDGALAFAYGGETIYPDGFLVIKDGGENLRLAVEIDESTESNGVFLREKIQRYVAFTESSERAKQAPWPFGVVVVARSEQRKENLRRLARTHGRKLNMFWFVSHERFSFTRRSYLLEPVFQTARDDQWHGLLD
ncbi:MAG TPA: replication-relaxation family protein [Candidatus Tectomicrobia bacterium]|nr:replication-relaxation family protein [Candidatus Tectomicrobia bacterium]